ncbi:unnamed protein product [Penicillium salamii]|uniref:Uncharacterized protein n=1 Tax=Penicillium salamii TaxID=1612424 RepID=A0A9W4P0E6_9EURO|nr:unnamed protein product [Penicillium salamii]CAG8137361.1 unnamed protein product [Penicillium salamii]CAG8362167.1 unnamed protein product [Penicillium salamii]CAG8408274.1 unnamed protein product [Penicillium salamii]CAG8409976.1 unnamed protein product [Penicillium salamii]
MSANKSSSATMYPWVYPEFQPKGRMLRKWMGCPHRPGCTVAMSTLSFEHINSDAAWFVAQNTQKLTRAWNRRMKHLGLPSEHRDLCDSRSQYRTVQIINSDAHQKDRVQWIGRCGPGVIFIDNIFREPGARAPHISELTKVAYEIDLHLSSLRYVFVTNILNESTVWCIRHNVYESIVPYQYPSREPRIWSLGSPEFDALLGTDIGKTVASFVLGSFGQGQKHVARIVTFHTQRLQKLNMRFDIG